MGAVGRTWVDQLTGRGGFDVTVVEQGLLHPGGHARGMAFQNATTETAATYGSQRYGSQRYGGRPCFDRGGGLEATIPERWTGLLRRHGWAEARDTGAEPVGRERREQWWLAGLERRVR
ncbi:hypothetical protein [Nonomuraea sp. NPDC050691]|uniref:hypothetical protein n=1 Tax=Nonomuraea sp. NPDC050691 TaxID=3155661 RepID=UPI0033D3A524